MTNPDLSPPSTFSPTARQKLRKLITLERFRHETEAEIAARGGDPRALDTYAPALIQIRISSADTVWAGMSESPERQLSILARYAAEWRFNPVALCFEMQSGRLNDKHRKELERFRQLLLSGDLEVAAVLTYNIDRFTRHRFTGEMWIETLRATSTDLHEADENDAPLALARKEDEYARKIYSAWRESQRAEKRVRDTKREQAKAGRVICGVDHYGHTPVWVVDESNAARRRRQVGATVVAAEAAVLREASDRLAAGEPLYRILCDLNDRGMRGRKGGRFNHKTLRGLLISPRMIGCQTVNGKMMPGPLEPILTTEQWERNREILGRTKTRATPRKYPASSVAYCGTCGAPMNGTSTHGRIHYRCSRPDAKNVSRCHCGKPDGRCRCRHDAARTRHGSRSGVLLNRFLLELALGAIDLDRVNEAVAEAAGRPSANELKRTNLEAKLAKLDHARRELARQVREGFITPAESDDELSSLMAKAEEVRDELGSLSRRRSPRNPEWTSSRLRARLNEDETGALACQLIGRVIERVVIPPSPRGRVTLEGVEVEFAEGLSVPPQTVEALRTELTEESRNDFSSKMSKLSRQATDELEDLLFGIWRQGLSCCAVAARVTELGVPTPSGKGRWSDANVGRLLRRACKRHGVEWVRGSRANLIPVETRNLIHTLAREKRPWGEIVADLERLGHARGDGKAWSTQGVRAACATECARRGEKPAGRRHHLPEALRRQLWSMARGEGRSNREIAEWLNGQKIPRYNGKPWDSEAVRVLVLRYDAKVADAGT